MNNFYLYFLEKKKEKEEERNKSLIIKDIMAFLGSVHTLLRTCFPAGLGSPLGRGLESFGWQPPSVSSGLFGRRGIE